MEFTTFRQNSEKVSEGARRPQPSREGGNEQNKGRKDYCKRKEMGKRLALIIYKKEKVVFILLGSCLRFAVLLQEKSLLLFYFPAQLVFCRHVSHIFSGENLVAVV